MKGFEFVARNISLMPRTFGEHQGLDPVSSVSLGGNTNHPCEFWQVAAFVDFDDVVDADSVAELGLVVYLDHSESLLQVFD